MVPYQQHISKFKKVKFHNSIAKRKKNHNAYNVKININGSEIKHVNLTIFLIVYIDEHLSWAQHTDYLSKKIA